MRDRRNIIAVSVLGWLLILSMAPTAEAGPLLDWLFQRNRSRGLFANTNTGVSNPGLNAGLGNPSLQPYNTGRAYTGLSNSGFANPQQANSGYYRSPFQSNTTSSGPYTAGYGATGRKGCLSCLFGGNSPFGFASRSSQPGANSLAQNAGNNPNAVTAGFAPQGNCSSGWCRQTVLRYVPQVAYRTAYEQVPVTTYKTSTTVNPANGLPMICTRPCTSYTPQARRVAYTTYRPVYTTVPVSDPMDPMSQQQPQQFGAVPNPGQLPPGGFRPSPTGMGSPFAAQPFQPIGSQQPFAPAAAFPPSLSPQQSSFGAAPYTAGFGSTAACPVCQNGNSQNPGLLPQQPSNQGFGIQGQTATPWTPVPNPQSSAAGYSQGSWQPPGTSGAIQTQRPYLGPTQPAAQANGQQTATPWQPIDRQQAGYQQQPTTQPQGYYAQSQGASAGSYSSWGQDATAGSNPAGATPWQPVQPSLRGANSSTGQVPAERAPSLRPNFDDAFSSTAPRTLRPAPISEEMLRRWRSRPSSTFTPNNSASSSEPVPNYVDPLNSDAAGGYSTPQSSDDRMFAIPSQANAATGVRPQVQTDFGVNETRRAIRYHSRAVRDIDRENREKAWQREPPKRDDKTANADRPRSTRYSSSKIQWSTPRQSDTTQIDTQSDATRISGSDLTFRNASQKSHSSRTSR